jgi:hypothetical protein
MLTSSLVQIGSQMKWSNPQENIFYTPLEVHTDRGRAFIWDGGLEGLLSQSDLLQYVCFEMMIITAYSKHQQSQLVPGAAHS